MTNTKNFPFSLLIAFVLLVSPALRAQNAPLPGIEARILNSTGVIAPGSSDEILVELVNPEGSGRVVTSISGSGSRGGYVNYTRYVAWPVDPVSPIVPEQLIQRPEGCTTMGCIDEGQLPLQPGEQLILRYKRLVVPDDVPEGTLILLTHLFLDVSGEDEGGEPFQLLYTDKNVARIVSRAPLAPSAFDSIEIDSPAAGSPHADVDVELHYPAELLAGEHFNLHATLRNQGEGSLFHFRLYSLSPPTGAHAESFNHLQCWSDCILAGSEMLQPGEQLTIELGNFHYEADELRPGTVELGKVWLTATDHLDRRVLFVADAPPVEIAITTPEDRVGPNEWTTQVPPREPLQVVDLDEAGDALLLRDPNTGNEWVKLTATYGVSREEVLGEMAVGGRVEGFSVASSEQVKTLLLNHVHASGVHAQAYSFNDIQNRSVQDALAAFLELMGIDPDSSYPALQGAVSDLPSWPLTSQTHRSVLIVRPSTSPYIFSSSDGVTMLTWPLSSSPITNPAGTWLVRASHKAPERPATYASFYETTLQLPSVTVDGEQHAVSLVMVNPIGRTFRLAALEPAHPGTDTIEFDEDTGRLFIPRAALLLEDGTRSHCRLRLEYLPDSNPPLFRVIEMEPVKD